MDDVKNDAERDAIAEKLFALQTGTDEYRAMLARDQYPVNFGEKSRGVAGVTLPLGSGDAMKRLARDLVAFGYGVGEAPPATSDQLIWHERCEIARAKLDEHIAYLLSCLEEARKDSERLDWMDAGDNNDGIMLADPERYSPPHTRFMWSCWPQPPRYFATLREAIDAARTAHPSPSAVEGPSISQSGEPLTNDT